MWLKETEEGTATRVMSVCVPPPKVLLLAVSVLGVSFIWVEEKT